MFAALVKPSRFPHGVVTMCASKPAAARLRPGTLCAPILLSLLSLPPASAGTTPAISGSPPTTGVVGQPYSFTPSATGPSGETLRFTILDTPSWASFSSTTGQLSGTPTVGGSYSDVVIGVTDGTAKASLAAFTITVSAAGASQLPPGAVTISWTPPTENANGSTLTNLAGYHLYYGTSQSNLNKVVDITNPGLASYSVDDLSAGTWYFALTSVNSQGVESVRSAITSATVQ